MAETAGERLQALMATQKIKSAAEVSRRSGVPESTIRTYLLGTRNMSFDSARKFALALGVNPEWLYDGKGSMSDRAPPTQPVSAPEARSGYTAPPQFFDGNDLPVFAAVEGGPGEMVVNSDPVDYVVRPWFLRNIKEGYAVIVSGESMVPLFEPGDMVLVNPRLPVVPGKAAIFVEGEERGEFNATVKRFVKSEPDIWRARQFNPEKELALPKSRWRKALRIVGKYDGY